MAPNVEAAARTIGVAPKTLVRWMGLKEFQDAYREARRAAFGHSISRLQHACSAAVSTLLKVMVDPNSPPSTRVRAADSVLNHSKHAEIEDVEVRVAALKQAAELSKNGGR